MGCQPVLVGEVQCGPWGGGGAAKGEGGMSECGIITTEPVLLFRTFTHFKLCF
jgi:hypothetical protein